MRKVLLALSATFAVCLAVFAGTNMCVKKQNGDILRINVDDVYEVYFEDIFNPDTSAIVPPFIEPSIADSADFYPLEFEVLTNNTVAVSGYDYRYFYDEATAMPLEMEIEIPAKVKIGGKVYSVTSIGGYAFLDCSSLTSIEIPSSVTSIGEDAFNSCCSLTSIEIPSSVTEIGSNAFVGCGSLTSVAIPSSVTSIGDRTFVGCSRLTSIAIPSSVTEIGSNAFDGCSSLESINVDAKNPNYSSLDGILYNKDKTEIIKVPEGIKGSFSIPESVTSIGSYTFSGCSSLESINVDVKNPNYSSLDGIVYNKEKTEIIAVPEGFKGSISIPEGVTSIGRGAFEYCSSLTSVAIPSSVTSIGSYTFSGCSSLTSIAIPSSVTSIGWGAFYNCENLDVVIENSKENVKFLGWNGKETTMEKSNAFYGVKSVKWLK